VRSRFWVESLLAVACGLLVVLTLFVRDWLEVVFRVDPDGRSGAAEWIVVSLLAAGLVVNATLARHEWRRAAASRA
jgi:uncharacterized membrane protein YqhA